MAERLITVSEASQRLGVTKKTLQVWDNNGELTALRTAGGHRRYRQSDIEKLQGLETEKSNLNSVCVYCRVSSQDQKQKGDLDRQKARLLEYCAEKEYKINSVLVDVCSGMKAKRPRLKQLFKLVSEHKINRVVVEYKDRLTRFCFEVFEAFFNSHGVEIECVEEVFPKSFENELVEDILSLLSSFSSRIYGKRSAEFADDEQPPNPTKVTKDELLESSKMHIQDVRRMFEAVAEVLEQRVYADNGHASRQGQASEACG